MALPPDGQTISQRWPYRQTKPALYGLTAKPNQLSVALPPNQTSSLWPYRQTKPALYGLTARPNQLWPYRQTKPALCGLTARPNQLSVALPPNQLNQLSMALPPNQLNQLSMALPPNQTSYGLTARPNQLSLWPYRQTKPALYGLTPDQTRYIYIYTAKPNQLWPYGRQTKPELTDYGLTARPDHLSVALPPVQTGSRRSLHLTGKRNRAGGGLDQGPAPNGA